MKFALRARANNDGKNPSWTAYEKIREVIEKRMFSQVEDLLPVISFGAKQDSKTEKQHTEFLKRMKPAATRRARSAGSSNGTCASTRRDRRESGNRRMAQFIDRRLNPRDKSLGNRQRFLRRTRAEIKRAVDKAVAERAIADIGKGGAVSIPTDGIGEPRFHLSRDSGEREFVLPGNKEFVAGDRIDKPKGGGGGGGAGEKPRTPAAARTLSTSR